MPSVNFEGAKFALGPGETVLDSLLRHRVDVPSSCRSGVCQTCLMRAESGVIPSKAQAGLRETLRMQGYFLTCVCMPETDMQIARPDAGAVTRVRATVTAKDRLNTDILRLMLRCNKKFEYRAGQFLHLYRHDGLVRSYSIASVPGSADHQELELHIRRLPGGEMTGWIHESLEEGDQIDIAGPAGNCFYVPGRSDQPLLLIGTGSGLAPLLGIVHDALSQHHAGPIHLYHGSWTADGLYLVDELHKLDNANSNFHYHACVDSPDGAAPGGYKHGRADQLAFGDHNQLKGWRVFLCGHPDLVTGARKRAFLLGASMNDIFADPFVLSKHA